MRLQPLRLFAVALIALVSSAQAEPLRSSPLLGAWAVDTTRLPMPPQARPRSVTFTFAEAPNGGLATRVEVVDATGGKTQAESIQPLDGTPTTVQGNLEADIAAASMPASGVLVMQLARAGTPASTRIYTITEGGAAMVETVAYFGTDGKPRTRSNYFSRLR